MTRCCRPTVCVLLAATTLREGIRSRLLSGTLLAAGLIVSTGLACASASLFAPARLVVDLGLAATSLLGTGLAAACAFGALGGRGQTRSEWQLLTRPILRSELLLGRFLGLAALLCVLVVVLGGATLVSCVLAGGQPPASLLPALWQTIVELCLSLAVALALAAACSPPLAATLFVGCFLAGQLADELRLLADGIPQGNFARLALLAAFEVLPDYGRLSLRGYAAANLPVPSGRVAQATLYGMASTLCWLLLACVLYGRRGRLEARASK